MKEEKSYYPTSAVELLKKGAEAELWLNREGQRIVKRRIEKKYRVKALDVYIRKTRTRREARLLERARRIGVLTPRVFRVDEERCEIEMEFVNGERLKERLLREPKEEYMEALGRIVARLHRHDIVHGDLTTSNVILAEKGMYLIDFGLGAVSRSVEDKAVDLVCFKKSYFATHPDLGERGWNAFLKGYGEYEEAERVLKRMEEVERRARYL